MILSRLQPIGMPPLAMMNMNSSGTQSTHPRQWPFCNQPVKSPHQTPQEVWVVVATHRLSRYQHRTRPQIPNVVREFALVPGNRESRQMVLSKARETEKISTGEREGIRGRGEKKERGCFSLETDKELPSITRTVKCSTYHFALLCMVRR